MNINIKDLEKYRKQECFCNEMEEEHCKSCGSYIPHRNKCYLCSVLDDLIKFCRQSQK